MLAICAALTASFCGPDLTDPGSVNVSGRWFAAGPAAGLSNITLTLNQDAAGNIDGMFSATGTAGEQSCPATGACALADTVRGANTVLQVNLILNKAGAFTGQLITPTVLRGALTQNVSEAIEFDKLP